MSNPKAEVGNWTWTSLQSSLWSWLSSEWGSSPHSSQGKHWSSLCISPPARSLHMPELQSHLDIYECGIYQTYIYSLQSRGLKGSENRPLQCSDITYQCPGSAAPQFNKKWSCQVAMYPGGKGGICYYLHEKVFQYLGLNCVKCTWKIKIMILT